MLNIEIVVNQEQLTAVRERLAYLRNGANLALSRALNKTVSKARTVASTEIRKQVNLTAGKVREKLTVRKANSNQLDARLQAASRGLLMYNFVTNLGNARTGCPSTPIRVQVKPGNTVVMPGAFYVRTAGSNLLTPAIRTGTARGAIKVLHGPSVSQVFTDVKDAISFDMNAILAVNFQRETEWLYIQRPPPPGDGSEGESD